MRHPPPALFAVVCACAHAAPAPSPPSPPAAAAPGVDIAAARARGAVQGFRWERWSPEVFARAAREHRFLLVDGAAEWCH